jgi:hypothetical protein
MRRYIKHFRCLLVLFFVFSSFAQINEVFLSFQGYSGIINIPNAGIHSDGQLTFLFNNQTPPNLESSFPGCSFKNFLVTIGMFPFVEITGRFMNAFPSGPRDLSADIKAGYAFSKFNPWLPSIACGIQDISGGSVFLSTKYLVMSEEIRNLRLSIGYGTGPNRMKGLFYGLEYFISKYVQILFDDDADQKSGAIRFSTSNAAPFGTAFVIKSVFKEKNPVFTFSASLSYDLKKRSHQHDSECDSNKNFDDRNKIEQRVESDSAYKQDVTINKLQSRLLSFGFENISVISQSKKLFIRYENNRFNHNELDALGIVLGVASEMPDSTIDTIQVTMLRAQTPVASIEVNKKDYSRFLATGNADRVALKIDRNPRPDEKAFYPTTSNKTFGKIRCEISPRLQYFLGTEVSPFDYQLSLNFDYFMDLWPGARCGARTVLPLWNTANFDDYNAFSSYREKPHLNSAMLFQFLNFGHGMTTLLSTGFFKTKYFSLVGDLRFTDKSGRLKVGCNAGFYTFSRSHKTTVLPYVGMKLPLDISLLAMYGTFWEQDQGVHVSLTRSFDIVDVELFCNRTKNIFDYFDTFVGSQITIPLTFKKGMKPRFITVSGKNDWHTSISTRVAENNDLNYVSTACGVIPELLITQDADFFNRNRLDAGYINDNLKMLRDAWNENRMVSNFLRLP